MAKSQFQATETLRVRFSAFINKLTGDLITGDTCTITLKKPNATTLVLPATFDTDANIWKLDLDPGTYFIKGEWLCKAVSSDSNSIEQHRALVWGDYVDDISVAAKVAVGRWKINGTQLILYENDGTTVFKTFDLKDETGAASATRIFERTPV